MDKIKLVGLFNFLLALCLTQWVAYYNGFPTVISDTGTYIDAAAAWYVPRDRPFFYSLFIRIFSFNYNSIFSVIFVQAILSSILLVRIVQTIQQHVKPYWHTLVIVFTSIFTSLPWYVSQLTPDIFTAILIMSTFQFMLAPYKIERIFCAALIFFSIIMHNSNVPLMVLLVTSTFFVTFIKFKRQRNHGYYTRILLVGFISVAAYLSMCLANYAGNRGFRLSYASHVFLVASFCEKGVLKDYLDANCPDSRTKLCQYKNNLPGDASAFVWYSGGVFEGSGGWDFSEPEYKKIISAVFQTPRLRNKYILQTLKSTFRQLFNTRLSEGNWSNLAPSNVYWVLGRVMPKVLPEFVSARQQADTLIHKRANVAYKYLCLFSVLCMMVFMYKRSAHIALPIGYFALAVLLNAFVTAALTVDARYNARVVWLIPFVAAIVIVDFVSSKFNSGRK